jgi:hypothetical protein
MLKVVTADGGRSGRNHGINGKHFLQSCFEMALLMKA